MNPCVLIIEDIESVSNLLEKILKKYDYEVDCSFNYFEGIKKASIKNYDFIFIDINLTGEINDKSGLSLCKAIKQYKHFCHIYAISGFSSESLFKECRNAGFDDFFEKPFKTKEILKTLECDSESIKRWCQHLSF